MATVFSQDQVANYRQSNESLLQPTKTELPTWKKVVHALDIFSFLPTPITHPVSTKWSLLGSFLLITLFLSYVIYSFVEFITNNIPRINQTTQMIDTQNYTLPETAIGFFYGDPFSSTVINSSVFDISMTQITKHQNVNLPDIKTKVPLKRCRPDWVPDFGYDLLCPTMQTNLSGLQYATPLTTYPRYQIDLCNSTARTDCATGQELFSYTSGGRVLLYIKNDSPKMDYATGDSLEVTNYSTYQFFLNPSLYLRSEIIVQKESVTVHPNFFSSFSDQNYVYLSVQNEIFYLSNVTIYNSLNALQIWVRLAQDQVFIDVVKQTIIDVISQWGAFWGVLFAGFAFIFLRFNMNRFYKRNPDWQRFEPEKGIDMNINVTDDNVGEKSQLVEFK